MSIRTALAVIAFSAVTSAQQVSQPELRVDTAMAMAHQNNMVEPVYPAAARATRIEGTVWVDAHIGADGRVHRAKAVSGPIELRQAAVASVLQRTFIPFNRGMSGSNAYVDVVARLPIEFQMPLVIEERNPLSIAELPEGMRVDLADRGCLIPHYPAGEDSGYAKGSFRFPGSRDFTIVCHNLSRKQEEILVYSLTNRAWKGEVIDRNQHDSFPSNEGCYSDVGPADPTEVRETMEASGTGGDGRPPLGSEDRRSLASLNHDSVGVNVCDKQEIYYYFDGERWHQLAGGLE